jgi:hypothetical protein
MTDPTGDVMNRNACRNCRRPIYLLRNIGWLHGELPQYAYETPTCDHAVPVDPRCPHCDDLVPAISVVGGVQLVLHHMPGIRRPCPGSGTLTARPQ